MKILLIDTFGFLFRAYYAPKQQLKSSDGFPTGVLFGFGNLLWSLYEMSKNDASLRIIFALEGRGNHRKEKYSEYKSNRSDAPADLEAQIEVALDWISKMQLGVSCDGFEADDVIATLSKIAHKNGFEVQIYSQDKDLYQLINNGISLTDLKGKKIDEIACLAKFGVKPEDFINFQAIVGDSSDNIPGIKGIGDKGAVKLIAQYKTLENIFANLDEIKQTSKSIFKYLNEGRDSAFLSRELVTLEDSIFSEFDFENAMLNEAKIAPLFSEFERYNLSVLDKFKGKVSSKKIKKEEQEKESEKNQEPFIQQKFGKYNVIFKRDFTPSGSEIAILPKDDGYFGATFEKADAVGVGAEKKGGCEGENIIIFELKEVTKCPGIIFYDAKNFQDLSAFEGSLVYDVLLLAWLLDSSQKLDLDFLLKTHFNVQDLRDELRVACILALFYRLKNMLLPELFNLYIELESKLIFVLLSMEKHGINIDIDYFNNLKQSLEQRISTEEERILSYVDEPFNIASTKQLSEVLFEKLKLDPIRKTKSGFSTDEATLEELKDKHEIISHILQYRELSKLKNTYVEPMLLLQNEGQIHTSFIQSGTATGRLSSRNPNLQSIPVRSDLGREIRRGFVKRSSQNVLLSVDYSQIELRLLAHFSEDQTMIEAFLQDSDIHLKTAQILFGEDAQKNRNIAKSINFGLIYGMGARKLSQTLKIAQKDAKEYIQSYFASFPTVQSFLKAQEELILQNGFASTLLGHRRYFNFDSANDFMRANFLREGINSIFQGSAADLIKLAMVKIYERFKNTQVKLLLQVHDELIFELPRDIAQNVSLEIEEIMNNIYKLRVPLKCGKSIGENWAELK